MHFSELAAGKLCIRLPDAQRPKTKSGFFYYKTPSGREVDFLTLQRGRAASLLQVCWSLGGGKTLERELAALSEAVRQLGAGAATIVTMQDKGLYSQDGVKIEVLPISEWIPSSATS